MKILLVSADDKWKHYLLTFLQDISNGYDIVTVKNGSECLDTLKKDKVQLVILDYVISGVDAFSVAEFCEEQAQRLECIIAVPRGAKDVLKPMGEYKHLWLMEKRVDENLICSVLHGMGFQGAQSGKSHSQYMFMSQGYDTEIIVTNVLHDIGIPAHIKGYQYMRYAILLAVSDMDILNAVTKQLYPEIAEKYNTTAQRVERAIRHAILVAWERGKTEQMMEYFSYSLKQGGGRPTNSEFIAMIADKIRLECKVKSA